MKKILQYTLSFVAAFLIVALALHFSGSLKNMGADTSAVGPATYYVSLDGDDANDGTSVDKPLKTIDGVNALVLNPGDRVLFKRGATFYGSLGVKASGTTGNPITFGAYGEGNDPVLTGFVALSGWKDDGGGIWESSCSNCGAAVNMVTINGKEQAIGRYPNTDIGYLTVKSHDAANSITDSAISSMPDWTGGDVIIRKNHWIIDRNKITGQSGDTISYSSASKYAATDGYGYFIENHIKTLDKDGEWYYDSSSKKFSLYNSQDPSNQAVLVAALDTVINISNQNYITIDGLTIEGSNQKTISLTNAGGIAIVNSDILFSGTNGIEVVNVNGVTVQNNTIAHTNNNAFTTRTCTNCSIIKNTITDTAMIPGMGKSADGNGYGINISGSNNRIANNTVTNTGYIGINFNGQDSIVENNVIDNFASVKDDGGGIYLWTSTLEPQHTNRIIRNNIVINGAGASAGAYDARRSELDGNGYNTSIGTANGIYLDDNAAFAEVSGNTISNNNGQGIFIHNAHDFTIANNTIVNNAYGQILMAHDSLFPNSPVRNVSLKGNTLISSKTSQLPLKLMSIDDDFDKFGTFANNGYFRPAADADDIVFVQQVTAAKRPTFYYNLAQFQSAVPIDTASTAVSFSPNDAPLFQYNASSSGIALSLNGAYKDISGKVSTNSITIPAFGSVALLKTTVDSVPATPTPVSDSNTDTAQNTTSGSSSSATTTVTNPPASTTVISTPVQSITQTIANAISGTISQLSPTLPTGTWTFIPIVKSILNPTRSEPVSITPSIPTKSVGNKKSYTVVDAKYYLNGTLVHETTAFPDGWSIDTKTLADGSYTLVTEFLYADGTKDSASNTFSVVNDPTVVERIIDFVRQILKK